jgi:hypothetical protein
VLDRLLGTTLSTLIGQDPVWGALALQLLLLLYGRPVGRAAAPASAKHSEVHGR